MAHQLSLEGKTAFISAAGQGIGRAGAEAFARAGASVFATDINESALAELDALDGITARKPDVTNAIDIDRALSGTGTLDVLFNCAGFIHSGSILECTDEEWRFAFDLKVSAISARQFCREWWKGALVRSSTCPR